LLWKMLIIWIWVSSHWLVLFWPCLTSLDNQNTCTICAPWPLSLGITALPRLHTQEICGLIKKYPTKGQEKLTNLWCCSPNPLQSSPLQTPHACSSGPSIDRRTTGTDSLEQPTGVSLLFVTSPPSLQTYSPSTAYSPLGIGKSHTRPSPVNWGNAVLVGSDV
jgi:hypothetical protein